MKKFHYHNTEKRKHGKHHVTRTVVVRGTSGHKSVTRTVRGKKKTVRRPIHPKDICAIRKGVFVKGLFDDCADKKGGAPWFWGKKETEQLNPLQDELRSQKDTSATLKAEVAELKRELAETKQAQQVALLQNSELTAKYTQVKKQIAELNAVVNGTDTNAFSTPRSDPEPETEPKAELSESPAESVLKANPSAFENVSPQVPSVVNKPTLDDLLQKHAELLYKNTLDFIEHGANLPPGTVDKIKSQLPDKKTLTQLIIDNFLKKQKNKNFLQAITTRFQYTALMTAVSFNRDRIQPFIEVIETTALNVREALYGRMKTYEYSF